MEPRTMLTTLFVGAVACGGAPAVPPPPGLLESAAARERGRIVYLDHCALCHGLDANGQGVRANALSGPPRDFTSASWRSGTSPGEMFVVVRDGKKGTSMASWRSLTDDDLWDVVAYVWSVGETAAAAGKGGA